jgi:isopenicillin N synthase-like dioxygenase
MAGFGLILLLSEIWLLRPGYCQNVPLELPIIDISSWIEEKSVDYEERALVAIALDEALRKFGCFLIRGHGLMKNDFTSAISSAYGLFSIENELKRAVEVKTGGFVRGYIGFGKESGLEEYFEAKEGYSYGYSWSEHSNFQNPLQGVNVWPQAATDVETFDAMFSLSNHAAVSIMKALSSQYLQETTHPLGIDLEGGDTISIMRLFHYFATTPPEMGHASRKPTGSSPHTDWGLLTVITQEEETNGLQFYLPSAGWVDIPSVPGTMVVNGGDFLRLASGGRYVSPIHRVLSPSPKDRISYVFFFYPNYNTLLPHTDQPGTCVSPDDARSGDAGTFNTLACLQSSSFEGSERLSFGEYITKKWEEVYRSSPL